MTLTVNIHEAKTQLSQLLSQVVKDGQSIVICNRGKPVADLCPHRPRVRTTPHPCLSRLQLKYDPTEPLQPDEWPPEAQ
jgi:prevent-host-death family protein